MELIGVLCTIGYVIASALILCDERIQILFPGGKLGFIAVSILFILLVICFAKEKYVKHVSLAVGGGIVLASSLIFIDKTLVDNNWKNNYFQNRLAKLEYHYRNYHSMSKHSWDEYEGIKMTVNRLSWTVVRLVVCNVSIVVGMLVVIEQEITTFCQRLFKFVKARMVSMDDHRN